MLGAMGDILHLGYWCWVILTLLYRVLVLNSTCISYVGTASILVSVMLLLYKRLKAR